MQQNYANGKFNVDVWHLQHAETLEKLINIVHNIHNTTSSQERLFVGQHSSLTLKSLYAHSLGLHHYSITSLLYLRTIQDKYTHPIQGTNIPTYAYMHLQLEFWQKDTYQIL